MKLVSANLGDLETMVENVHETIQGMTQKELVDFERTNSEISFSVVDAFFQHAETCEECAVRLYGDDVSFAELLERCTPEERVRAETFARRYIAEHPGIKESGFLQAQ